MRAKPSEEAWRPVPRAIPGHNAARDRHGSRTAREAKGSRYTSPEEKTPTTEIRDARLPTRTRGKAGLSRAPQEVLRVWQAREGGRQVAAVWSMCASISSALCRSCSYAKRPLALPVALLSGVLTHVGECRRCSLALRELSKCVVPRLRCRRGDVPATV